MDKYRKNDGNTDAEETMFFQASQAGKSTDQYDTQQMNAGQIRQQAAQQAQQAAQQAAAAPANGWTCSCGATNTGKFCTNCGSPKPAPAESWTCSCGATNTGKFCTNCGSPKPASAQWTCSCGAVNTGKFCTNCGKGRA